MSDLAPPEWLDRTPEQVRDEVVAYGVAESGTGLGDSVSHLATVWEPMGLLFQRLYATGLQPTAEAIDVRTAPGWWLRIHGLSAGEPWREEPRAAQGYARVTSATGGTMPAGTVLEAGGQQFGTDREVRLGAGVPASVAVTALVGGAAGNVAAGTAVEIPTPVPADLVATLPAQWVTVYGFDADTDDAAGVERYRARVRAALAVRGEANTEARYRLAAIRVPGVTAVRMLREPRDYGSTDLLFLARGDLPTPNDIDLVRAAVDREGLVCRDLWVRAPRSVPVVVEAEISGTATEAEVEAAIEAWWLANVSIGDPVEVEDLYQQATSGLPGLLNILYTSPVANLPGDVPSWYRPTIRVTRAA